MRQPQFPDVPFTYASAAECGITRRRLRAALESRLIRRVFRGVYVRGDLPDSTQLRAQAARLVMNEHSVICDRTAAWIHGIDVLRFRELDLEPSLESYVLRGHDPTDRHDCHGGTRDLKREDWMVIEGVRVTTPLRTALDLACKLPRRDAMAALDAFARQHAVSEPQLRRLAVRYFRRRGVIQARQLIPLVDARHESMRESWVKLEISDHSLPMPQPQWWVDVDGIPTYRLDFAYPHARIAIEYDGEEFHTKPEDREADERRRKWLGEHGWIVIVLTKESFTDEGTTQWIKQLRAALH